MKNISIWQEEISSAFKKLDTNLEVDVLIIGGGITGISTAYHLINKNLKIALVEKNIIGSGVTSRTTGKLTYLQENIYSKLKTYHNEKTAKQYLESQKDAIKIVNEIIKKEKIDCNLEQANSYIFSNTDNKKLEKEKKILKKFKVDITITNELPNKEPVNEAIYVDNTYVFHPIKYINTLKKIIKNNNIDIFENTKIISIEKKENYYICKTNNNYIKTKYIVFAIHYPYFLIPYLMPIKTSIEKSYIEAFKVDKNYKFSSITVCKPTISTRYHSDKDITYELFLTMSHNTSIKENDIKNFETLLKTRNKKPDYIWSNKDIITHDSLPFIGALNKENTMLIGTGYNTWGMTNGSIAGKILSDIILKKPNKYINLFDPKRKINLGKIINFPLILGSNTYSFLKSKISKNKSWYSNKVKFKTINGKNVGIYIDENNKEHIVYNLCPHMKCSLIFNEIEKTWDCPCHGSRFDIDGNVIEGPSNYNIKYEE